MIDSKVRSFLSKAFGFSFSLIPEELMAQQIVVDALTAFFLKKQKSVLDTNQDTEEFVLNEHKDDIYKQIFVIARKRFVQQNQFWKEEIKKINEFHALSFEQKAVLTLYYRLNYKVDDIVYILQIKKVEVLESLNFGRSKLANFEASALNG
ncbi:MAG: hypothetical protein U0T83_10955 [Bacteriovoracaceae bacterium]